MPTHQPQLANRLRLAMCWKRLVSWRLHRTLAHPRASLTLTTSLSGLILSALVSGPTPRRGETIWSSTRTATGTRTFSSLTTTLNRGRSGWGPKARRSPSTERCRARIVITVRPPISGGLRGRRTVGWISTVSVGPTKALLTTSVTSFCCSSPMGDSSTWWPPGAPLTPQDEGERSPSSTFAATESPVFSWVTRRPINTRAWTISSENVGDRFVQRQAGGLPSERDSRCSSTGDFDRDGRQDFLSCSFSLRLYRNVTTVGGPVAYRQMAGLEGIPVGGRLDAEMSDLNRDGWPDLVTLTRNVLEVRLNTQMTPHFPMVDFRLPLSGGFSFCSGNANGDGARDLLVVRGVASNDDQFQQPDRMLINTGAGDAFEIFGVPQPPTRAGGNGNGDTCSAIPNYQGGRAAWVISNGRSSYGPEEVKRFGYRQLVILSP